MLSGSVAFFYIIIVAEMLLSFCDKRKIDSAQFQFLPKYDLEHLF